MATVLRFAAAGERNPAAGSGNPHARRGIDSPPPASTAARRAAPSATRAPTVNLPVLVPGVLVAAAGAGALLFPARFIEFTRSLLAHPAAKWYAGGVRLVLGALILTGSGDARHPAPVATAGALLVIVGAVLILLPRPRFEALAGWGAGLSPANLRLAAVAAIALGAWLAFEAAGGGPA